MADEVEIVKVPTEPRSSTFGIFAGTVALIVFLGAVTWVVKASGPTAPAAPGAATSAPN